MPSLCEAVNANGFESEEEFFRLVSSVDLSTPGKIFAFTQWKLEDGTKDGLLKLIARASHAGRE
jgi:hypothetical protein